MDRMNGRDYATYLEVINNAEVIVRSLGKVIDSSVARNFLVNLNECYFPYKKIRTRTQYGNILTCSLAEPVQITSEDIRTAIKFKKQVIEYCEKFKPSKNQPKQRSSPDMLSHIRLMEE